MKLTTLLIMAALVAGAAVNAQGATRETKRSSHKKHSPPTPITCLKRSGLHHVKRVHPGVWSGQSSINKEFVFVDGPYKTVAAARSAVNSLKGVEIAARGGRYEVTATIPSRLNAWVGEVANCLSGHH